MYSAPSVSYPTECPRQIKYLLGLAWALGVITLFAWSLHVDEVSWRHALTALSSLLALFVAMRTLVKMPTGTLCWDGLNWSWTAHVGGSDLSIEGLPAVYLDWQRGMLIRFSVPAGQRLWLGLSQSAHPVLWNDLRRAMFSNWRTQSRSNAKSAGVGPKAVT